jgi:hypothetical protein
LIPWKSFAETDTFNAWFYSIKYPIECKFSCAILEIWSKEIAGELSGKAISSILISIDPIVFGAIFTYLSVTCTSATFESLILTEKYPDPWFI